MDDWGDWNTTAPGLNNGKNPLFTENKDVDRAMFNYERWKQVLAKIVSSNYLPNEPNDSIYVLSMDSQTEFTPWIVEKQSQATCAFHSYVNGLSGTGINAADTYFFAVLGYVDGDSICYQIASGAMKWAENNVGVFYKKPYYIKAVTYLNTLARKCVMERLSLFF